MTSLNRQHSHTPRLVSLLLNDQPYSQHTGSGVNGCYDVFSHAHVRGTPMLMTCRYLQQMRNQVWRKKPGPSAVSCTLTPCLKVCPSSVGEHVALTTTCPLTVLSPSCDPISPPETVKCAGRHRLQPGHAGAAAAGLFRAHADRTSDLQLRARQRARAHRVQRQGGGLGLLVVPMFTSHVTRCMNLTHSCFIKCWWRRSTGCREWQRSDRDLC